MAKYILLKDDSPDSIKAAQKLKEANIEYESTAFSTDGDLQPPVLFMPEGKCEGLACIKSFAETIKTREGRKTASKSSF